jgi:hypothetical protein
MMLRGFSMSFVVTVVLFAVSESSAIADASLEAAGY